MEEEKKLPMGWEEAHLGDIAVYINGRAFKSSEWEESGLPIVRIQNLNDIKAKYNYSTISFEEKYKVKKGDLLFAWSASLGVYIWNLGEAWLNQHIFKVIPEKGIDKYYLYYALDSVVHMLYTKTHGSGMVHITKGKFEETTINLPPVQEQQRIVEKIEELFSELDKGVENLKIAQQQLKVYRQSVLNLAFEGKLTEKWRKSEWIWTTLGDFAETIKIGPFGTLLHEYDYVFNGIPVINPKHIKNQKVYSDSKVTVSIEKSSNLSPYFLKENDIILGRRGEMGRTACVTAREHGWICGTGSMIIRLKENNLASLYSMMLAEKKIKNYLESNCTGTTMKNLNEKIVKKIPIPIIPPIEQQQILQEIESRLSVCDRMEETIKQSLLQAEALRQSILKKAFEGKLVPQDPNDESAELLLKRIKVGREAQMLENKTVKRRTKK